MSSKRIFSQIDSNKFDLKGSFVTNAYPLINKVDFSFRDSAYEHLEGHAEEEGHHDDDHSESEEGGHGHEEPTLFKTDATGEEAIGLMKEELEIIEEESKKFKPKPWWAYGLFYCYLLFYGYIFWMEPLKITG